MAQTNERRSGTKRNEGNEDQRTDSLWSENEALVSPSVSRCVALGNGIRIKAIKLDVNAATNSPDFRLNMVLSRRLGC